MRRPNEQGPRYFGIILFGCLVLLAFGVYFGGWTPTIANHIAQWNEKLVPATVTFSRSEEVPGAAEENEAPEPVPAKPEVEHVPLPEAVKAIYMSQCAATSDTFRTRILKIIDETEVNAVIVDLKDYSGAVAFPSKTALPGGKGCRVSDFRELIKMFHERDIYVIGRLTVFQDPLYTSVHPELAVQSKKGGVWKDHKGLAFVDVGATPFHSYIVTLAREAHALGVDEINFDYIRYPSDGNMLDTKYDHTTAPHPEMLEKFFAYLATEMRKDHTGHVPILSADLFGMVTTNYDDLNIGQVLERALPYFDFIAPMVYPSHYPTGFMGFKDVNAHGYDIVHHSMKVAAERTESTTSPIPSLAYERIGTSTPAVYKKPAYERTKLRPWLQDFDYPVEYTPEMVQAQIKATYDAGLTSWMFWDPANRYDSLRQVLPVLDEANR